MCAFHIQLRIQNVARCSLSAKLYEEVVFAEKGNLVLLGARTLASLNLTIDPRKEKYVAVALLRAAAITKAMAA